MADERHQQWAGDRNERGMYDCSSGCVSGAVRASLTFLELLHLPRCERDADAVHRRVALSTIRSGLLDGNRHDEGKRTERRGQ